MQKHYQSLKRLRTVVEIIILFAFIYFITLVPGLQAVEGETSNSASSTLIIDDIICEGNQRTECGFITKKYYQKIGDRLSPEKIEEAKLRLGTLNQFRKISVHLKKSQIRGHVFVVFNVVESDSIQFEFVSNYYNYSDNQNKLFGIKEQTDSRNRVYLQAKGTETERLELEARVTDYNFLGTGKQLSLLVATRSSDLTNLNQNVKDYSETFWSEFILHTSDTESTTAYLDYYDPHLFGSTNYFFSGQVGYSDWTRKTRYSNLNATDINPLFNEQINSYSFVSTSIGKRFAEYSTISLTANKAESEDEIEFGWTYGWNSQDDTLFPTQGSFFRLHYDKNPNEDSAKVHLDFQKNHQLHQRLVISYGFGENVLSSNTHQLGTNRILYGTKKSRNNMFVKLSGLLSSNTLTGDYSGWNFGLAFSDSTGNGLFANYVYHTDKLIFNFGLTYQPDGGIEL